MWGETRSGISTSLLKDRLLVTLQGDLTGDIMERLQTEVLGLFAGNTAWKMVDHRLPNREAETAKAHRG